MSRASVLGNVEAHGLRLEIVRRWEFAHKETYHLKLDNCVAMQHPPIRADNAATSPQLKVV